MVRYTGRDFARDVYGKNPPKKTRGSSTASADAKKSAVVKETKR